MEEGEDLKGGALVGEKGLAARFWAECAHHRDSAISVFLFGY